MPRFSENLDGGLWTSPDPAFLQPGQLSGLQNGVYKPGSLALQRALGRTAFGTASAATVDVVGLRDVQFDNGNQYLIAVAGASALTAAVGDTGTFAQLATFTSAPTQLEVAHYRNRFYMFSGLSATATVANPNPSTTNLVSYLTATAAANTPITRPHGLVPTIATPAISTAAGSFSQTVTGYYEYWTTEVAKYTQDGAELLVEGTFSGKPGTVFIATTAIAPTIAIPARTNPTATHWRVYRSPKKDAATDKKFPTGFMIAEGPVAATALVDATAGGTTTSFSFPSLSNSSSQVWGNMGVGASAVFADDSTYATLSTTNGGAGVGQIIYGFNFGGFTGAVTDIEVRVEAYISAGAAPFPLTVDIGVRNSGAGVPDIGGGNPTDPYSYYKIGSQSWNYTATTIGTRELVLFVGLWIPPDKVRLTSSDFDSNFAVRLRSSYSPTSNQTLSVNYVKARVTYAGSSVSVIPFPTVIYTLGDISAQVGKNGQPPSSTTGDIFEDQLVVNDVANSSLVRWSAPQDPDSFPSTYYDDIETRENDQVRVIKVVNSQLVVLMDSAVWRYNYLPSELDSSFDRGKSRTPISRSYGAFNAMCACTFSAPGMPEQLAFVGDSGFHTTDGFNIATHSIGLNWRSVISTTSTSNPICLVNDRENREILFYYRNDANGNETYLCLHFSYSSEHMVNGMMKVSGPVNMRNYTATGPNRGDLKSAWSVQRSTGATNIYLGYGGTGVSATAAGAGAVYRENGTVIPAQDSTMSYITRRMYQAGFANEWKLDELYGYAGSYDINATASYTLLTTKTDDTGEATQGAKTIVLGGQKLHHVNFAQMGEGIRVSAVITASAYAQQSLTIEGEGFGMQDSGR